MPRRESPSRGLYGEVKSFWSIFSLPLMTVIYPVSSSCPTSVHFAVPCCTQRSFQCPTEDGFSASLAKCPWFQLHLRESFSVLRLPLSPSRLRGIPPRDFSTSCRLLLSPLPLDGSPSFLVPVCQVWSLILQRGEKRSAEYTEQRYRVARSLAHSPVEARGENEDLCETITRGGEIRPRRYHSDTDGYSRVDEKI